MMFSGRITAILFLLSLNAETKAANPESYDSTANQNVLYGEEDSEAGDYEKFAAGPSKRRRQSDPYSEGNGVASRSLEEYPGKRIPLTDIAVNCCATCGEYFRFNNWYEKHCREEHGNALPYRCPYCTPGENGGKNDKNAKMTFASRMSLMYHVNAVHSEEKDARATTRMRRNQPITCELCGQHVKGLVSFEKHAVQKHTGIPMVGCGVCGEKFIRRKNLSVHEYNRHSPSLLMCECKNIFKTSQELKKHRNDCQKRQIKKRRVTNELTLPVLKDQFRKNDCQICQEKFDNMTQMKKHYQKEHPYHNAFHCDFCKRSYCSNVLLEKHVDLCHAKEDKAATKWRKKYVIECEYCGEQFQGIGRFEKHGVKEHPRQKMFRCGECGGRFRRKHSMSRHARSKHTTAHMRCSYCSECYARLDQLKSHEKSCMRRILKNATVAAATIGRGQDVYCDICQKTLRLTKKAYKCHKYVHKFYENCPYCHRRFHRIGNPDGLRVHMQDRHPLQANIDALLQTAAMGNHYVKIEGVREDINIEGEGENFVKDEWEVKTESHNHVSFIDVKYENNSQE